MNQVKKKQTKNHTNRITNEIRKMRTGSSRQRSKYGGKTSVEKFLRNKWLEK